MSPRYRQHDLPRSHPYPLQQEYSRDHLNAGWPATASYAPGYAIYDYSAEPRPPIYVASSQRYAPRETVRESPLPPQLPPRRAPVYVRVPEKRVHFDLPTSSSTARTHHHADSQPNSVRTRRPTTPAHPYAPSHPPRQRPSSPSSLSLPRPPTGPPSNPVFTVHVLTFSTRLAPTSAYISTLLNTRLPPSTTHLYTISVSNIPPPPATLCTLYSGVSTPVRAHVLGDVRARAAVERAVEEVLKWVDGLNRDHGYGGSSGNGYRGPGAKQRRGIEEEGVAISVRCENGTHRSVAVGEEIARRVKEEVVGLMGRNGNGAGGGRGVRVVVEHVHRIKGPRDPY